VAVAAALATKYHWVTVVCDSCGTVTDLDLTMKRRISLCLASTFTWFL
jgi:hypothetical protein